MELSEKVLGLLGGPNFGVLATIGSDGAPQTTAIWVDTDGEHLLFATTTETVKYRNLVRDARVAITVMDHEDPYLEANLQGRVIEIRQDGVATIDRLSGRYYGVQPYPYHKPGHEWVTVVVEITKARTNR
jgi:PPOX class probable F420-dependent enzyme